MDKSSVKAIKEARKQSNQMAKRADRSEKKLNAANRRLGPRDRQAASVPGLDSILSVPSKEYAQALADPFEGPLASIPDYPPLPSRRLRVWNKGFFSTGSGQFGFVIADPYSGACKDVSCVWASTAAYAGTVSATTGAGVQATNSNSDYGFAEFQTTGGATTANSLLLNYRVVASGLRIRYSSTELNRGGVVVGATSPNHYTISGYNFAQMNAFECSRRFRPQQRWMTALYCPVKQTEINFSGNAGSYGGVLNPAASYVPTPIMGFFVQAPDAAVPVAFEYEFYTVYEVIGPDVRGLIPSLADPAGHAAVTTAAQALMVPHDKKSSTHASNFVKAAATVATHTLTGISKHPHASENLSWMATTAGSVLTGLLALL